MVDATMLIEEFGAAFNWTLLLRLREPHGMYTAPDNASVLPPAKVLVVVVCAESQVCQNVIPAVGPVVGGLKL